jgi:hypothetical protein
MKEDRARPAPFIGIGGLVVAAFLYGYAAIALPSVLHSVVLPLLWLLLFVLGCRLFTRRPRGVLLLAGLAIAAWFAVVLLVG